MPPCRTSSRRRNCQMFTTVGRYRHGAGIVVTPRPSAIGLQRRRSSVGRGDRVDVSVAPRAGAHRREWVGDDADRAIVRGSGHGRRYATEFLDLKLSRSGVQRSPRHRQHTRVGSGHGTIVTRSRVRGAICRESTRQRVVNASTRFVDGEEFGFGAEIGIHEKLHARPEGCASGRVKSRVNGDVKPELDLFALLELGLRPIFVRRLPTTGSRWRGLANPFTP